MVVYVEADSKAEARTKAREDEYEHMTAWEPVAHPYRVRSATPKPDFDSSIYYDDEDIVNVYRFTGANR